MAIRMVGFDPASKKQLSGLSLSIGGASSGVLTRVTCQPLDVLKIRFQLQSEPLQKTAGSKYYGIAQASRLILREEGLAAFWKGHNSAQGLSVIFGVAQFYVFETLTRKVGQHLPSELTTRYRALTHGVCGAAGGAVASTASMPFDVLRTRFVAQGNHKTYTSIIGAVQHIYRGEGYRGFFKGLLPTLLQSTPYTGLQFGFYSLLSTSWRLLHGHLGCGSAAGAESLVCGGVAGVLAKVVVYPLDVVKKRLQIQGFAEGRKSFGATPSYKGFVDCGVTMLRHEGFLGFYKGFSPSVVKAAATSACIFFFYEQTCRVLLLIEQ